MTTLLLVLQFTLTVLLTIVILLQKSESMGFSSYSGSNESLFGSKGANGFLTKTTAILGIAFIINTIALGYSFSQSSSKSVLDSVDTKALQIPATNNEAPVVPTVPANPTNN